MSKRKSKRGQKDPDVLYRSKQSLWHNPWFKVAWAALMGAAGYTAFAWVRGGQPLLEGWAAIAPVGIVSAIGGIDLKVEVRRDSIAWSMGGLLKRRIDRTRIQTVEAVEFRPFRDFWGWGIRRGLKDGTRAYTVHGNRGVRLLLIDGKKYLLGVEDPQRLVEAWAGNDQPSA